MLQCTNECVLVTDKEKTLKGPFFFTRFTDTLLIISYIRHKVLLIKYVNFDSAVAPVAVYPITSDNMFC